MSVLIYKPSAIVLPTGNAITQIEDRFTVNQAFDHLSVLNSGAISPGFTGSNQVAPQCDLSTTQIKDVLDFLTTDDICRDFSGVSNVDLEYYKMNNLGTRDAIGALSHARLRGGDGMVYWSGFNAQGNAPATIDLSIMFMSDDGVNAPLAFTSGLAITAAPTVQHVYGLGGVKIAAAFICVDSLSWSNNANVPAPKTCSGAEYPEFVYMDSFAPIVTVQTENAADVLSHIPKGTAITNVDFFLRKREASGVSVAAATAEHIKITATAGTIKPGSDVNSLEFHIHNFTVNTASAIS